MALGKTIAGKFKHLSGQEDKNNNQGKKKKKDEEQKKQNKPKKTTGQEKGAQQPGASTSLAATESDLVSDTENEIDPWICEVCTVSTKDENLAMMECERCAKHYCSDCIEMSEEVYNFMSREEVLWCCESCVVSVRSMLDSDSEQNTGSPSTVSVKKIREDLDATMHDMKSLLNQFQTFIHGSESKKSKTQSGTEEAQSKEDEEAEKPSGKDENKANKWVTVGKEVKSFREIVKEATEESRKEAEAESRRRKNFTVHRLPEKELSIWTVRKSHDGKFIEELMELLEINPRVEDHVRLGKREMTQTESNTQTPKHRPLRVTLTNQSEVAEVMSKLYKLKDASPLMNNVRISQDLNLQEREEIRALVTEAKNRTRTEKGDYMHIVRDKKIIRVRARNQTQVKKTDSQGTEQGPRQSPLLSH